MRTILLPLVAISRVAIAQSVGSFFVGGSMTTARSYHTATVLSDGTVLIAGGYNASGSLSSAEVYDPVVGSLTGTGPMIDAPSPNTATLLADGRVLLVGTQAQLYDPSTRTFAATGYGAAVHGCAATLLGSGKVLFTDDPPPYGSSATAELYNPDTGSFVPTGPYASIDIAQLDHMIAPNWGGWDCRRATLLADGGCCLLAESPRKSTIREQTHSALQALWLNTLTVFRARCHRGRTHPGRPYSSMYGAVQRG